MADSALIPRGGEADGQGSDANFVNALSAEAQTSLRYPVSTQFASELDIGTIPRHPIRFALT